VVLGVPDALVAAALRRPRQLDAPREALGDRLLPPHRGEVEDREGDGELGHGPNDRCRAKAAVIAATIAELQNPALGEIPNQDLKGKKGEPQSR